MFWKKFYFFLIYLNSLVIFFLISLPGSIWKDNNKGFLACTEKYLFMCSEGFKMKLKTPPPKKKWKPSSLAWFSQVQQVNLKNKFICTSPAYLSIDTTNLENSTSTLWRKKVAVKLKSQFDRPFRHPGYKLPYGRSLELSTLYWY